MSDSMNDIYLPMIVLFFVYQNETKQPLDALSTAINNSTVSGVVKNKATLQVLIKKIGQEDVDILGTLDIAQLMTDLVSYDTSVPSDKQSLVKEANINLKNSKGYDELAYSMMQFGLTCISAINRVNSSAVTKCRGFITDMKTDFLKGAIEYGALFVASLTLPQLTQQEQDTLNAYLSKVKAKDANFNDLLVEEVTDVQNILNSYLPKAVDRSSVDFNHIYNAMNILYFTYKSPSMVGITPLNPGSYALSQAIEQSSLTIGQKTQSKYHINQLPPYTQGEDLTKAVAALMQMIVSYDLKVSTSDQTDLENVVNQINGLSGNSLTTAFADFGSRCFYYTTSITQNDFNTTQNDVSKLFSKDGDSYTREYLQFLGNLSCANQTPALSNIQMNTLKAYVTTAQNKSGDELDLVFAKFESALLSSYFPQKTHLGGSSKLRHILRGSSKLRHILRGSSKLRHILLSYLPQSGYRKWLWSLLTLAGIGFGVALLIA